MLQIKKLTITYIKDLRVLLNDFNLTLNDGDKAVIRLRLSMNTFKKGFESWVYAPRIWRTIVNYYTLEYNNCNLVNCLLSIKDKLKEVYYDLWLFSNKSKWGDA